jgi:hypothetical protein
MAPNASLAKKQNTRIISENRSLIQTGLRSSLKGPAPRIKFEITPWNTGFSLIAIVSVWAAMGAGTIASLSARPDLSCAGER